MSATRSTARANASFGLTTLRNRHVKIGRGAVRLVFTGKSGLSHDVTLRDRRLVRAVRNCHQLPGQLLFQYEEDDGGELHAVHSNDVNDYLPRRRRPRRDRKAVSDLAGDGARGVRARPASGSNAPDGREPDHTFRGRVRRRAAREHARRVPARRTSTPGSSPRSRRATSRVGGKAPRRAAADGCTPTSAGSSWCCAVCGTRTRGSSRRLDTDSPSAATGRGRRRGSR